jgi:chaperonin GroES
MNIHPLGNRLVVKLTKIKNTSASGFILSSEEKNEQAIGEVIAIGGGQGTDENIKDLGLKVGDVVLFGKYGGEEIADETDENIVYKILKSTDVVAIIK